MGVGVGVGDGVGVAVGSGVGVAVTNASSGMAVALRFSTYPICVPSACTRVNAVPPMLTVPLTASLFKVPS